MNLIKTISIERVGRLFLCAIMFMPILLLQACNSDDDDNGVNPSEYFFRYKLNGSQVDYPFMGNSQVNLTGSMGYHESTETYTLNVGGFRNIFETGTNTVTILISSTDEIKTGITYSNVEGASNTVPDFMFLMGYYDDEGDLYTTALNINSVPLWKQAYVRFEVINEHEIKGTFSGTLVRYDSSSGENVLLGEVALTEGEFKVPRF